MQPSLSFASLKRVIATLGVMLAMVFSPAASAQPSEIEVPSDEDFKHQWTAMTFATEISSFERTRVAAFEERETNLAGSYFHAGSDTILTLYIYRPGNPSTAIWFDRALVAIGIEQEYGSVDLEDLKIGSFVPNGGSKASGLSAVLAVDGNFRSTGVALYRSGEWIVKVRISSRRLAVPQMDAALKDVLAELPALADIDDKPAQFVAECSTRPDDSAARTYSSDLALAAMGQAITVVAAQLPPEERTETEKSGNPVADAASLSYCREGQRNPQYNVYRSEDARDQFSVAIGDAGRSVEVYPYLSATELSTQRGEETYAVQTSNGLEFSLHMPFVGLPNLEQVAQSMNGQVIATVSRPLEDGVGATIELQVSPE